MAVVNTNKPKTDKALQYGFPGVVPDNVSALDTRARVFSEISSRITRVLESSSKLGESSRQLVGHRIDGDKWSSTVLRNVNLPLISGAFNYVLRRAVFIPSILSRKLDLPWSDKRHKLREESSQLNETPPYSMQNPVNLQLNSKDTYKSILPAIDSVESAYPFQMSSEIFPSDLNTAVLSLAPENESLSKFSVSPMPHDSIMLSPIIRHILTERNNDSTNNDETHHKSQSKSPVREISQITGMKQSGDISDIINRDKRISDIRVPRGFQNIIHRNEASTEVQFVDHTRHEAVNKDLNSSTDLWPERPSATHYINPQSAKDVRQPFPRESAVTSNAEIDNSSNYKVVAEEVVNSLKTDKSFISDKLEFIPANIQTSELPEKLVTKHDTNSIHLIKAKQPITEKPKMNTGNIFERDNSAINRTTSKKTGQTIVPLTSEISNNESLRPMISTKENNLLSPEIIPEKEYVSGQTQWSKSTANQSLKKIQYKPSVFFTLEQEKRNVSNGDISRTIIDNRIGTNNHILQRDVNILTDYLQTHSDNRSTRIPAVIERISSRISATPQHLYKSLINTSFSETEEPGNYDEYSSFSLHDRYAGEKNHYLSVASSSELKAEPEHDNSYALFRNIADKRTDLELLKSYREPEQVRPKITRAIEPAASEQTLINKQQTEEKIESEVAVNVRAVAEKVYALIKRDLRIERERDRHRILR